jgi:hydrophobic/amphiphilic exporter-1 (mainly G- bacteria), HAE1 family
LSISDRAVKRPIATFTIVTLVLIIGLASLWKTPLDLLPEIKPPLIAIITVFPGSSPQETLNLVTTPIEAQAAAIGGLTNLSSLSQENLSLVLLKFHWGSDLNSLRDEISARLDLIRLPEEAGRPMLMKFDPTLLPVMQVAVSSSANTVELTEWLNRSVRPRLEKIEGVAGVEVQGGAKRDLFVRLDPTRLAEQEISFDQVANIMRASLLDLPAGITELESRQMRLRFLGRPAAVEDLANLVVGFHLDEERLQQLVGSSMNLNLNQNFSANPPVSGPDTRPTRTVTVGDFTGAVRIDETARALIIELDPDLLKRWGLEPRQLPRLMPRQWRARLDGDNIVIPLPRGADLNWETIKSTPLLELPDFEAWLEQMQEQTGRELTEASSSIERSLTEMATAMVLASAAPGATPAMLEGDFPLIPVHLGSVAEVAVDLHRPITLTRVNGQPSVSLVIQKEGEANTVSVSRQVRRALTEMAAEDAGGRRDFNFLTTYDQAREIEKALADLAWALLGGSLLAIAVLLLFLKNWRTVAIIGLSIPIAVTATFSLLYFTNLTINLMTLGAMALAAGLLVDNAIVVSENIYRHFQQGSGAAEAAVQGSKEVTGAIIASTLTTISVFFPVVFVSGLARELFRDFALTVSSALLASLAIALTVIPLLASRFLRCSNSRRLAPGRENYYHRLLTRVMKRPWAAVGAGAALISLGLLLFPLLGRNLFPNSEESSFYIDISAPAGTTLQQTGEFVSGLEQTLAGMDEVDYFISRIGETQFFGLPMETGLANQARLRVHVADRWVDQIGTVMAAVRKGAGELPEAVSMSFTRESLLDSVGMETKLELVVEGPSLERVNRISADLAAHLRGLSAVTDVKSVTEETRPEVHAQLDHDRALQKGVTVFQVATTLRQALEGLPVSRLETEHGILSLILGFRDSDLSTLEELAQVGFYSSSGSYLQLGEFATFEQGYGPTSIPRENQQVVGIVQAQYRGDLGAITGAAMEAVEEMQLPPGYSVRAAGTASMMQEVFGELWLVLVLAAVLVYLVMAAQFESLLQPLIIISSIPLALAGSIIALLLTGNGLSVPAMIGAVVLAGILVNDGIIMIDLINQQRRLHGREVGQAIVEGAAARLRPIMMTTITTILGLAPLALGLGAGSQLQAPMAVVIIGGQITGTALLLVVIPAVYRLTSKTAEQ